MPNSTSTYAKVTHAVTQNSAPKVTNGSGLLTVYDVANLLGKSHDTVKRWCQSGKIPAIPKRYGKKTTYPIPQAAIPIIQQELEAERIVKDESPNATTNVTNNKPHASYFASWVLAMQKGLMTGKPFSPFTVLDYETFVRDFLKLRPVVSAVALRDAMIDIQLTVTRNVSNSSFKLYKSVVCFAKFAYLYKQ
jgi:hypothetical protein